MTYSPKQMARVALVIKIAKILREKYKMKSALHVYSKCNSISKYDMYYSHSVAGPL